MLRPFVNALTSDENYFLCKRDNFPQPIQMTLSQKLKTFSQFFAAFLKSTFNFEHFPKKDQSHRLCLSRIMDCEIGANVNKCLKRHVSVHLRRANYLKGHRQCCNMKDSSLIVLGNHSW